MLETLHLAWILARFVFRLRLGWCIPLSLATDIMVAVMDNQISAETGFRVLTEVVERWSWLSLQDRTAYLEVAVLLERLHAAQEQELALKKALADLGSA